MSMPDAGALLAGEPAHDQAVFETRVRRYWADLLSGLTGAYPGTAVEMANRLVEIAANNFRQRSAELRLLVTCAGMLIRNGFSTPRCWATPPTPTFSPAT